MDTSTRTEASRRADDELIDALRGAGSRITRPRRAVWRVLVDADAHLTVDQIDTRLREAGASVDLASVYRALALFAELGLARETRLGEEAAHWERAHPDEHFHLVCVVCGAVDHHVGSLVAQIRDHLDGGHGFEVEDVELVVSGRCARCRAPRTSAS
jgi:Fur family transcriptional regulator, ferric uptake regulator